MLNMLSELDKLIQKKENNERSQQLGLKYVTDTTNDLNSKLQNIQSVLDQNQLRLNLKVVNAGMDNKTSNTTTHGRSKSKADLSRNKPDMYTTTKSIGKTPINNKSMNTKTPTKSSVTNLKSNAFKNEENLKTREKSGLKLNKTLTNLKDNTDKKEVKAPLTVRSKGVKDFTENKLKNSQTITNINSKHQKTLSSNVEKNTAVKEKTNDKSRGVSKNKNSNNASNSNANDKSKEISSRQKTPGKNLNTKEIKDKKSIKEEVLSSVTSASSKMRINHLKENLMPKKDDEVIIDQTKMINIEENSKVDNVSSISKEKIDNIISENENLNKEEKVQTKEIINSNQNIIEENIKTKEANELLDSKVSQDISDKEKIENKNEILSNSNTNSNTNINIKSNLNQNNVETNKSVVSIIEKESKFTTELKDTNENEKEQVAMIKDTNLNNDEYVSDSTRKIKFINRTLSNLKVKGIQTILSFLTYNEKINISKFNRTIYKINLPLIKNELSEICNNKINEWNSKKQQIISVRYIFF